METSFQSVSLRSVLLPWMEGKDWKEAGKKSKKTRMPVSGVCVLKKTCFFIASYAFFSCEKNLNWFSGKFCAILVYVLCVCFIEIAKNIIFFVV